MKTGCVVATSGHGQRKKKNNGESQFVHHLSRRDTHTLCADRVDDDGVVSGSEGNSF